MPTRSSAAPAPASGSATAAAAPSAIHLAFMVTASSVFVSKSLWPALLLLSRAGLLLSLLQLLCQRRGGAAMRLNPNAVAKARRSRRVAAQRRPGPRREIGAGSARIPRYRMVRPAAPRPGPRGAQTADPPAARLDAGQGAWPRGRASRALEGEQAARGRVDRASTPRRGTPWRPGRSGKAI